METTWGTRARGRRLFGVSGRAWAFLLLSVTLSVVIWFVGDWMARLGTDADLEEPVEVIVIDPDSTEPFIVCTIRPRVRHCHELYITPGPDLTPGQP